MRIFVAVELPDSIKEGLRQIQRTLQGTGDRTKWVGVSSLHLTLKFLGEISEERLERVFAASREVAEKTASFFIELAGVGAFPNCSSPRVIWVGVRKGKDNLVDLALHLDRVLSEMGFAAEKRKWVPHLTLGRVKELGKEDRLKKLLLQQKSACVGEIEARQCSVIRSLLTPTGPLYTTLKGFPLGGEKKDE